MEFEPKDYAIDFKTDQKPDDIYAFLRDFYKLNTLYNEILKPA